MKRKLGSRKKLILFLAAILVFSNMGITFAYWASGVSGNSDVAIGDVSVGNFEFCTPIFTDQEFYDFATSSTSSSFDNYCLRNDIDFSSFTWTYLAAHTTNQFQGRFDGRGFTLSNITIETSAAGTTYLSIFSRMNGGTIKNVEIENYGMGFSTAYFNSSAIQAGIFAGEVTGLNNLVENITITNAEVIGSSINGAGGLFGQIQGDTDLIIRNIKATNLTVLNTSKRVGGLISRANSGTGTITIEDIDLQGYIASDNATSNTGGIYGTFRELTGTISRAVVDYIAEGTVNFSDGSVTFKSNKYVGGFVGNNNAASLLTIYDSFYTGELYNVLNNVGTVLGRKKADIILNEVYYSNVLFVNAYVPSSGPSIINSTEVNAASMPSSVWWDSFYVNYNLANSLWTQDGTGRPILIR